MRKSNQERDAIDSDHEDSSSDEIEILEIVGLDEDQADLDEFVGSRARAQPAGVASADPDPDAVGYGDDEAEDAVVLDLDQAEYGSLDMGMVGLTEQVTSAEPQDSLMRLQADFDNYKKRVEREHEVARRQAAARLIDGLLPALDNFERAIAAVPRDESQRTLLDGIALIFRQVLEALRKEGLAAIETLGQPFDPHIHEAVETEPSEDMPPQTIIEEIQRGYLLHGRVLRPAAVKVSVPPASRAGTDAPDASQGEEV